VIKGYPDQEIILHDPDLVTHLKCKRIGADIDDPAKNCKLLDFGGHLSKRDKITKEGMVCAAAGGPGREFINLDELIQA